MEDEEFFEILHLVDRFNKMLETGQVQYHDLEEFELVVDYFADLGKLRKALKVIDMALDQHPFAPTLRVRRVQLLTAGNKVREAHTELEQLSREAPDSYDLYLARAGLYSRLGQHHKAIGQYEKCLSKAEFPEDVWVLLAMEYQMMGDYRPAAQYLQKSLEVNSEDEVGLYNLALCFDLLQVPQEAVDYFSAFIDRHPYSEVAWYQLGSAYAQIDDYDHALWALDYAIIIDEFFSAAYFDKAHLLEKTYRYPEAIDLYLSTIEFQGAEGYTYYRVGLCHLALHQPKKALKYFTKAVQEDGELDAAYYELALLHDENESWDEAVYSIKKSLHLDPENVEYKFIAADIHRRAGLLNEAGELYREILAQGYEDPKVYLDYCDLLFDLCEFDQGMAILAQGLDVNPRSAELYFRSAGYYFTLESYAKARYFLQKALRLDPSGRLHFYQLFPRLKKQPEVQRCVQEELGKTD